MASVRAATTAVLQRIALALLLVGGLCAPPAAQADDPLVFAAASLKPALDAVIASPAVATLGHVKVSYAASSQLALQIEAGAPASLFVSADQDWMDYLAARRLILASTRSNLLGNALVLVAPSGSTRELTIANGFDLAGALGAGGHLAVAEPDSVPAGKYAKAALVQLGAWKAVESRIVAAENVRAALNFVARGEVPLGIVYRSDAVSEPRVRVLGVFPATSHAPIVYPVAIVAGHDSPTVRKLRDLLHAAPEQAIFHAYGFSDPSR